MDSGRFISIKKAQEDAMKDYNNKQEEAQEQPLSKADIVQMYCDIYKVLGDLVRVTEENARIQSRILNKLEGILDEEERANTKLTRIEDKLR